MRQVLFTLEGLQPGQLHRTPERFAVPLAKVRMVVLPRQLSRIPRGPAPFLGIMNLRGRVVPVVDLGQLVGLEAGRPVGRILVLDRGRTELGLAVNDVMGTADLESRAKAPPAAPPFVAAVGQDDAGAVTLIDADLLDTFVGSIFHRALERVG